MIRRTSSAVAPTAWASFSDDECYRYELGRDFAGTRESEPGGTVLFVMLNPSTADEQQLDPTLRRCKGFALAWGCSTMLIGNLFALRSTDPEALYTATDPVGPENNAALCDLAQRATLIVAGWGVHGAYLGRAREVLRLLRPWGLVHALKVTKGGHPTHPLYLPNGLQPILYEVAA